MVEYETLKREEIEFGENDVIEVARKRAISGEGDDEFIALARGFITEDGDRRFKTSFSVPIDDDVVAFLQKTLPEMLDL